MIQPNTDVAPPWPHPSLHLRVVKPLQKRAFLKASIIYNYHLSHYCRFLSKQCCGLPTKHFYVKLECVEQQWSAVCAPNAPCHNAIHPPQKSLVWFGCWSFSDYRYLDKGLCTFILLKGLTFTWITYSSVYHIISMGSLFLQEIEFLTSMVQ